MKSLHVSVLCATLAAGVSAFPATAQVSGAVHLRQDAPVFAGPGYEYPQVDLLSWNQPLHLYGCLREVAWCDVGYPFGAMRGWVDADNLVIDRGDRAYSLPDASAWYAYPVITFLLSGYWDQHYRHAWWYRHRDRYSHWDWRRHSHHWDDHDHDHRPDQHRDPGWRDHDRRPPGRPIDTPQPPPGHPDRTKGHRPPPSITPPQPMVHPRPPLKPATPPDAPRPHPRRDNGRRVKPPASPTRTPH